RRHRDRVHRPPPSAGHRAGFAPGRRTGGQRGHAPAPARPSRRHRARPPGPRVHADPRQRDPLRTSAPVTERDDVTARGWWGVPIAVVAGAVRVGTPFLFVSLGECITEKGGRINLGLEGILVMGAMSGYALSYATGNPWVGVLAAGGAGAALGLVHAAFCTLPRVNDIAVGIGLMLSG